MKRILEFKLAMIGAVAGAAGGYLYYAFIGCSSGTCAITSNPINSTIYGAVLGALLFDLFRKKPKQNESGNNSPQQ